MILYVLTVLAGACLFGCFLVVLVRPIESRSSPRVGSGPGAGRASR
jgi:hypothetical protein